LYYTRANVDVDASGEMHNCEELIGKLLGSF